MLTPFLLMLLSCASTQTLQPQTLQPQTLQPQTLQPQPATAEASPAVSAVPSEDSPLPLDPHVATGILDNGLTWFIEPNAKPAKRAELRLVVKAGSVLEDADQRGGAHFLEHMAFNGTRNFPGQELIQTLEAMGLDFGADLNASTGMDQTIYQLQVPTQDPALLDQGLMVLDDWAEGMTLDPEEVNRERGVVLEEWRRSRGAGRRFSDALLPLLYHDSLYADRDTIGTQASLKAMTQPALARFYADWYRPELMAVIVEGDVDVDATQALIETRFSDNTGPQAAPPRPVVQIPSHDDTLVLVQADPEARGSSFTLMHKIAWSWRQDHAGVRDLFVERLVYQMLNQRLQQLSRQQDMPFIGAGAGRQLLTPTTSIEVLGGQARPGQEVAALTLLATEITRARLHGFTQAELDEARASQLRHARSLLADKETTDSAQQVGEIVRHFLTDEWMTGTEYEVGLFERILPQVDLASVNAKMADFMGADSRVLALQVPGGKDAPLPPTEDRLRAALAQAATATPEPWQQEAVTGELVPTPQPGTIVDTQQLPALGVTSWRLSNGVRVLVKPTDFVADDVQIRAWSWGGDSNAADDALIAADTAMSIARASGLGPFGATALSSWLSGRDAWVAPLISENSEGFSGSAAPDELELALQEIHAWFTAPRFDAAAFAIDKANRTDRLANRLADPSARFADARNQVLWDNHPRRRSWTVKDLDDMDLETSAAFFRDRFADANDFTFIFVGSVDLAVLRPLVERWLGSLPTVDRQDGWKDLEVQQQPGPKRLVVHAGSEDVARVRMIMHGPTPYGRVSTHHLGALDGVLETILRQRLREDMGGTYSVSVRASQWFIPQPEYRLTIDFSCDPDRVDELEAALREELAAIISAPPEAATVAAWVAQRRQDRQTSLERNGWWARKLQTYDQRDWPLSEILDYDQLLAGDSPRSVQDSARRWLKPAEALVIVLLPESGGEESGGEESGGEESGGEESGGGR